MRGVIWSSGII